MTRTAIALRNVRKDVTQLSLCVPRVFTNTSTMDSKKVDT
jgi:hypothetical protein